jgi:CRP-like cAMP-binding protein
MTTLSDDAIERLAVAGRVERLGRREILPLDGPTAAVVIDGWFRVFRNAAFARDVTLFLARRGDVLAPAALFGQRGGESGAQVHAKLERLSRSPAEARVAAALLEICDDGGTALPNGEYRLELPVSQEDLASLAGTTRETASTAVAAFARAGLVRGNRLNGLLLLDPAGLAAAAEAVV